ncbi:MAG: hypothetical protein J0649_09200 [Methylococcales bacterium]|nr:hypothetical protein [Methylococcales bacterium]
MTRDEPFHAVPIITKLDDGQFLSAIDVSDDLGEWAFADRYVNIAADDRVYHVEADDRQQVYIRFGMKGIVGVQPELGSVFSLRFDYSHGNVIPPLNSSFSLTSIQSPLDAFLTLNILAVRVPGEDPISIDALRTLAKYPSIYDANAVYLGEFDFLVRRNFPTLRFLSVWNERIEEHTREPSVDNVNCLFIACVGIDDDLSLIADDAQGQLVSESDWSGLQRTIATTVKRADDSYRVKFYTPVIAPQSWRIEALIGTAYQPSVIAERIRETILIRYGQSAIKRGGFTIAVQDVYSALRRTIPEIAEPGADIQVFLPPTPMFIVPESWRYVSDDSLTIDVKANSVLSPAWGW